MRLPRLLVALVFVPLVGVGARASADSVSDRLASYESEARALGADLPQPGSQSQAKSAHELVDAEVAYSLGDYDTAALSLFQLAQQAQGTDKEAATYYLAESLYQKGDLTTAHTYFKQLVTGSTAMSRYHMPALQRIVEIAIAQRTTDDSQELQAALGALASAGGSVPSAPYILGKYSYSQGNYDQALQLFAAVPKGSDFDAQAAYFTGATYVAKGDLAKATDVYAALVDRKPKSLSDRRVMELAQLALGRIYYEREQPAKSIDAYLLVDRHSDLFADALYEVAWVYVKGKQYDKALRALELLEQSDPSSTKTPTVRILEGNLRIRKAQLLRASLINGTLNTNELSNPAQEYDKANKLFTQTHDQFVSAYQAMAQLIDGKADPASFIDQIAGRSRHVFQLGAPVPEAATQMLREEPDVQVFDASQDDLADIQNNIEQSEAIIARLDAIIAANDRTTIYPALSARRSRIAAIEDDLIKIRASLGEQANDGGPESAQRRALAAQYTALGNPEMQFSGRKLAAQDNYDKLDDDAQAVDDAIGSSQAIAVALRKYALETPTMPAEQKAKIQAELDSDGKEAQAIEDELADVRRELSLGRDLAGLGDPQIAQARALASQVDAAEDNEERALANRGKASANLDRATRLAESLEQLDRQIDGMVAARLEQIKAQLVDERKTLASYKQELADLEAEARTDGATVLGSSFRNVRVKLDDIVTRTDVGNVDVAWSRKEDLDDDLKRLTLARSRELKQLKDEFKDVLLDTTPKPGPKKSALPPPPTEGAGPESPDKGGGKPDERIKPVEANPKTPAPQTVKPDEQKSATPKKAPATPKKKGGAQ